MRDVNLAFLSGETQRVPLLRLAAVFALPRLSDDVARDIIAEPFRNLGKLLHRADVGFLEKFAQRRLVGVLALVDTALRHLPLVGLVDVLGPVGAAADEHAAGAIEHHYADARPVGEGFITRHGADDITAPQYSRASAWPRLRDHCADRHQQHAAALRRLGPACDALDRYRQRARDADSH